MKKHVFFETATKAEIVEFGNTANGQDGAIYNDILFRFNADGSGMAFSFPALDRICDFMIDSPERICPHFNAVTFGTEFYAEGDEFPLLYANAYNNYMKAEGDRREGYLMAYRIWREGNTFKTKLVQVINVAFVHDCTLWCSENVKDTRPYGNFVIDKETPALYAFVMRDETKTTRFFKFALPKARDGVVGEFGVPQVTLEKSDILSMFDTEYMNYMQGATMEKGYIYSVEGFGAACAFAHGAIRIYDVAKGKEVMTLAVGDYVQDIEAEFIEVYQGVTYYSDATGIVFKMTFSDED